MVAMSAEPYESFALPHYADRDPAHNADHIRRILSRLPDLSRGVEPEPQPRLLHFLACFHGLAERIRRDDAFRAETESFLIMNGWTPEQVAEGFLALGRHHVMPMTSEEKVVHDANHLERLGAFGVAKAFTRGGADGQSYERTLAIFERNLRMTRFLTPRGRALATEGLAYCRDFITRLRLEL